MNCIYPRRSAAWDPIIGERLWRQSLWKHCYHEANKKGAVQQYVSVNSYSGEKKIIVKLQRPLNSSGFTIHHISFSIFFLFDSLMSRWSFSLRVLQGCATTCYPLHQLENYPAHEILYASDSSRHQLLQRPLWPTYLFLGVNNLIRTRCQ